MIDVLLMGGCLWYAYYAIRHGVKVTPFVLVSFVPLLLLIPMLPQLSTVYASLPSWWFLLADYVWVYAVFMGVFFCVIMYLSIQVKRDAGLYNL